MTKLPQAIRCTSFEEFKFFMSSSANQSADIEGFEAGLLGAETFVVPGYCAVCDREAAFLVGHLYCLNININGCIHRLAAARSGRAEARAAPRQKLLCAGPIIECHAQGNADVLTRVGFRLVI
jgi:hypothetical protein